MTNAVIVPLTNDMELVITADNSGAIGEKEADIIQTSNQVVGQFACRVALMENFAENAEPKAIIMQNFTNDEAWSDYVEGVQEVLVEAGLRNIPITGSTESNFPTLQSGLGLTIVGKRKKRPPYTWTGEEKFAVIGVPYVGDEVLKYMERIPPVQLLKKFMETPGVVRVLPVGSKGVRHAFHKWTKKQVELNATVDLEKTAGPATCFLVAFQQEYVEQVKQLGGDLFHFLEVKK